MAVFGAKLINGLFFRLFFFYFIPSYTTFFLLFGFSKLLFAQMNLVSDDNAALIA